MRFIDLSITLENDVVSPTALGGTPATKTIGISYYDISGINTGSLDNGDVRVVGPNGFDAPLTKGTVAVGPTSVFVNYALTPPPGGWKSSSAR